MARRSRLIAADHDLCFVQVLDRRARGHFANEVTAAASQFSGCGWIIVECVHLVTFLPFWKVLGRSSQLTQVAFTTWSWTTTSHRPSWLWTTSEAPTHHSCASAADHRRETTRLRARSLGSLGENSAPAGSQWPLSPQPRFRCYVFLPALLLLLFTLNACVRFEPIFVNNLNIL